MSSGSADLIFETPSIEEFATHLTYEFARLFGGRCNLTEPEPPDWNQPLSADARHFVERKGLIRPPQPNRPVGVLSRVPDRHWTDVWQRFFGPGKASPIGAQEAIEETVRRIRAAQEQEVERRAREGLPTSTTGDTWIRVGFRMHRSSAASPRLVVSVCEVYIWK
jgi:hypothetical protein